MNRTKLRPDKTKSKRNNKQAWIYFIVFVTVIVSIGLYQNTKKDVALRNYELTIATVTDFGPCNYSYCLDYVYQVNGKEYKSHVKTEYFRCEDGTEGCLGKKFRLKYSVENPELSLIDLEQYNENKLTKPTLENLIEKEN